MQKIAVVGSVNMDLVIQASKPPRMGETSIGGGFAAVPGGKGANQAVAAARLGADVRFIGCVGNDAFGAQLAQGLRRNGVGTAFLRQRDGLATGVAMIWLYGGDNCIAVDPGANLAVDKALLLEAEAEIARADMLLVQMEIPMESTVFAMELAHRHGTPVLLNPAPAHESAPAAKADIVTPNEYEAQAITGLPVTTIDEAKRAAAALLAGGPKQVVVTLGANGAVYNRGDKLFHIPALPVQAVDSTAAGDAFTAALAVMLSGREPIDKAVAFATRAGAFTVGRKGAQPSLPYKGDLP